jgi:HAMP domain-containing protein
MRILLLLMPVIWALVATGIGLLLYKSSSALFEQEIRNTTKTRRLRATGSVAIAAAAFLGMWRATPTDTYQTLEEVGRLAGEVERKLLMVSACDATSCSDACSDRINEVQRSVGEMSDVARSGPK